MIIMTWKNSIKKEEPSFPDFMGRDKHLDSEEKLATELIKYARNKLNLKGKQLETVFKMALQELELMRGEGEEESRVDSVAGSRFER